MLLPSAIASFIFLPKLLMLLGVSSNAIPLYWFLFNKPIPKFFKKGFEFDFKEIKRSWKIVKWELVRRMAPRVSAIIGVALNIYYGSYQNLFIMKY